MSTTDRTYSVGELQDLIAAKDVDVANVAAQGAALEPAWSAADAGGASAWQSAFAAVQGAYDNAKTDAQRYIDVVTVASLGIASVAQSADATSEYQAILSALNSSWADNTPAPGSFDALQAELATEAATLGQALPAPAPIPQPTSDTGINPTSSLGYLTGAAAKLGLVANPPPGTPGTAGAPPLIPSWLKTAALVVGGLWALSTVATIAKSAADVSENV